MCKRGSYTPPISQDEGMCACQNMVPQLPACFAFTDEALTSTLQTHLPSLFCGHVVERHFSHPGQWTLTLRAASCCPVHVAPTTGKSPLREHDIASSRCGAGLASCQAAGGQPASASHIRELAQHISKLSRHWLSSCATAAVLSLRGGGVTRLVTWCQNGVWVTAASSAPACR